MAPGGVSRQRVESRRPLPNPRASILSWTTLALLALLAQGGAAARPDGIVLGLPGTAAVVVVAAGLGLLWLLSRWEAACAPAGGLLFLPLLLLVWPQAPGVRAVSGAALLVPVLAAAILCLPREPTRWVRGAFLPVVAIVYLGAAVRVQSQVGAEGDEPHYLMVAESLLRDHDLALDRDYAEGRYRAFYRTHAELAPHFRVRGREGQIYSLHAVGLSVLILPSYVLAGYPGASFFMALLAALLAREIRELLRHAMGGTPAAEGTAWIVALSPPLVHYAGLVFTEVPAALAVAFVLRRGLGTPRLPSLLTCGLALAALPWLNVRYAALALVLLLYLLAARARRKESIALVVPLLVSAAGIALYHFVLYGFFDPRRVYGLRREFSPAILREALPGLFFDQEFGLLAYAPVFALAVPGLLALWRLSRRLTLATLALLAVVLLTTGAWPMWRGGFNPPARFLLPLVPALALALGARLRGGFGSGAALLVSWGLATGLAGAADPRLVHRDRDGTAPLFREHSGAEEWTRLLPAYVLAEPDRGRLTAVWAAALALAAVRWRIPRSPSGSLAVGSLGLMASAGLASTLSDGRTAGRDAVRVIGRPALTAPRFQWERSAHAEWSPADLDWGPLYEPHRHPDGAVLGSRLSLPPGAYRLFLEAEEFSATPTVPEIEVRSDVPARSAQTTICERVPGGLSAEFEVTSGDRAVSLRLRGGGPLLLKGLRLSVQPRAAPS